MTDEFLIYAACFLFGAFCCFAAVATTPDPDDDGF
jgi:hypothetical protein